MMTNMETQNLVPKTLGTLAPLPRRQLLERKLPTKLPAKVIQNPCRKQWQQKWLCLDVTHPQIQTLADEAERFAGRWFKNIPRPAMLVLAGNSGTGKTHVAEKVLNFCNQAAFTAFESGSWGENHIPSSLYLSWPETTDAFKSGLYGVLQDCFTVDLLILDDIGAEHDPSKNATDKLCQILTRRENKFTLVTTNIIPSVWPERFDIRVADRLLRNSIIIDLTAVESYAMR